MSNDTVLDAFEKWARDEMREAFEAWAKARLWTVTRTKYGYREWQTDTAWWGWQAAYAKGYAAGAAAQAERDARDGMARVPRVPNDDIGRVSGMSHKCICGRRITQWAVNKWTDMIDAAIRASRTDREGA